MTDQTQIVGAAIQTPGGQTIPLTAEQAQDVADAIEDKRKSDKALINSLIAELQSKRDDSIRSKREIERRWVDDIRQYDGDTRLLSTKEFPSQNGDENLRPPVPHLTRARTDLWESRMYDMLVPTDDSTWDLRSACDEDIQPPTGVDAQMWQAQLDAERVAGEQACERMRRVIRDQFSACNAPRVFRRAIRDACRIGTGLVMGPMNTIRVQRKFSANGADIQLVEKTLPEIREGDPWMFFPEMVDSIDRASYAHYLFPMNATELYKLADNPGFDKKAIAEVLKSNPDFGEVSINIRARSRLTGENETMEDRYPVWRYTGIVDQKYLEVLGLQDSSKDDVTGDLPPMVVADIWYCGQEILKSKLSPLFVARDFRLPYYVYAPFPGDDTMFGQSIPYLARDSQRSATSAWQIGLHNASVSSGPLIFARQGTLRPRDGKYSIRGPKWFDVTDAGADRQLNDLVNAVIIPNNAEQAFEIFQAAQSLMDEELNTIQWASPDTTEPTQTASGIAMLMNSRTILQRRASAIADDELFGPLVERFVLWNNLYSQRTDIKGNYDVVPLCQSVRLVKDIQAQQQLMFAQLCQNPQFNGMFDPYELFTCIAGNYDIPKDRILTPKDKWQQMQAQQQQQPQQNPTEQLQQNLLLAKTQTEHLRQQSMQAQMGLAQQRQQSQANADAQSQLFDQQSQALSHQEFMTEKQFQLEQLNSRESIAQSQVQAGNMQAAMNAQATRERAVASLRAAASRSRTELIKTGAQAHVDLTKAGLQHVAATKPEPLPKGEFKAPQVVRYSGGKHPGTV